VEETSTKLGYIRRLIMMKELDNLDTIKNDVIKLSLENHKLKQQLDGLGELEKVCIDCVFNLHNRIDGTDTCTTGASCVEMSKWKLRDIPV